MPGPTSGRLNLNPRWPFWDTTKYQAAAPSTGAQVYDKTGFATAGLVGTGVADSEFNETGFATAGLVGAGGSASEYTKTGFAAAGLVGSGGDVDVAVESGFGTVGGVASGSSEHVVYVPLTGQFDLGVHGATIATGDPGNATAWNVVNVAAGGTVAYDDTLSTHGGKAAKFATAGAGGTSRVDWDTPFGTKVDHYGRAYIYFTGNPASFVTVVLNEDSSFVRAAFIYVDLNGKVGIQDSVAGGHALITTNSIALNQWVRLEWHIVHSATVGQVEVKLFNSPESATPTETLTSPATWNTLASSNRMRFGVATGLANAGPFWMDSIGAGAGSYPGPDTSLSFYSRTGFATVGGVGSGASQKVTGGATYTKAGFATAGLVGSGGDVDIAVESGAGIAGLVGAGSSESTTAETGAGIAGLVGAGASASVNQEAGAGLVGTVGSGPSASVNQETGAGTVGTVGTGADVAISAETGFGTVGSVGAGFLTRAGQAVKTGAGIAGLVGSGADVDVDSETGFATVGGVGAGSRARDRFRSGFAVVGSVGSGFASRASTVAKAGGAVLATVAAGARAFLAQETGFGKAGTVGSGFASKVTASQDKTGGAVAGGTARGQSASVFDRTGSASSALSARGAKAVVYTETGYAVVSGTGTGVRVTEHTRTGHGLVGLFAHGDNNEHFDAEAPGRFVISHTGQLAHTLRGHTDRSTATGVASAANGRISRSKTGALT